MSLSPQSDFIHSSKVANTGPEEPNNRVKFFIHIYSVPFWDTYFFAWMFEFLDAILLVVKILDLYFLSSNGCDENVIIAGKERRNVILDNAPAFVGQKGENSRWSKSNFQFCTSKDFQVAAGKADIPTKEF